MLLNNKQIQRLHPIKSALLHLVKSSRLHGIHSPFIYHFLEDVVFSDTVSLHFQTIEELRYSLNRNNSELDFNDLGTGNPRKIKIYKIAESGISPSFGRLLYRISGWLTPKSILELGTSLGLSAAYLASGSPESNVISIEGCPQVSKIAGDNLRSLYIKNVSLRVGDITDLIPDISNNIKTPVMVFFDANHSYTSTIEYFNALLPITCQNSIFIFDDIHWSKDMTKAWDEICRNPEVSVCLDLFRIGIIFFNKGLSKQVFRIRF